MLIVHAVTDGDLPVLWVEGPQESAPARRDRHVSPYAVDPAHLAGRLPGFDELAPEQRRDLVLRLPAHAGVVLPSSPLVSEWPSALDEATTATLAPCRVRSVRLAFPALHELLMRSLAGRMFEPGVMAGRDLAWCAEVLWFATTLVARERFVPALAQSGDRAIARWEAMIAAEDAERLEQLAGAMPRASRASSTDPVASSRTTALVSSLASAFVDRLVRGVYDGSALDNGAEESFAAARSAIDDVVRTRRGRAVSSAHDRWIAALVSADGRVELSAREADDLRDRLAEWKRPLGVVSNAPFVLCFRLEEPPPADITLEVEGPVASNPADAPVDAASEENPDRAPSHARREQGGAISREQQEPLVTSASSEPWRVKYFLQAVDDPSLLIPVADIWRSAGRARLAMRSGFDPRAHVLQSLGQASSIDPGVDASLRAQEPAGYELDVNGAYEFLRDRAWALRNAGFRVTLPVWWTRRGRRQGLTARAKVKSPRLTAGAQLSLEQLVTIEWEVLLGDTRISRRELEALATLKTPLVRVRGQWVEISADDRHHALRLLERGKTRASARSLIQLALGASAPEAPGVDVTGVDADGWVGALLQRLASDATFEQLDQPPGFEGQLRPYQRSGYSWLAFLGGWGLGACLADDMGLGKTVQALAFLQRYRALGGDRPVLLVCPTSVVGNWQREAARFVPALPVMVHHGTRRPRGDVVAAKAAEHALVLSSYALLHRDIDALRQVPWAGVILDEAQNIKNAETSQARAARALPAGFRVALTGTPVENTVGDLWSLMEFLNPGLLGTLAEFKRRFFVPIQVNRDANASAALKRLTGPFVLRRLKTDREVAPDLPEKLEMDVFCTLTREQATLYAAVVRDATEAIQNSEGIQRKGVVLATLSKLKQVCNHPAQFLGDGSRIAGRSGKLARLTEMLEEVLSTDERALVFTQFAQMGGLIKSHLQDTFGREVLFLHGGTPKGVRDRMVERFQRESDGPPVFVLSLKAGGTGLNLTAARHVFLFDRWWNPAVEAQAVDRAHRIGQAQQVEVHKFLCGGTVEEQINTVLESKKDLAGRIIGTGEGWLTELSTAELKQLFELRKDAVAD